jgi:hypothetical protein
LKAKLKAPPQLTFREWLAKHRGDFLLIIRPEYSTLSSWRCQLEKAADLGTARATIFSTERRKCSKQFSIGKTPQRALQNFIHFIRGKWIADSPHSPWANFRVPRHFRAA